MAHATTLWAGPIVMDNTPEQSARLRQYFDEAVNLPQPEREALIERVRRDEGDEMADQLANMLKADEPTRTIDAPPGHLQRPAEPEEPRAFRDGEVILERFRIVRLLGRGGMGEVFEAHDQELGPVALKTVRRDLIGDRAVLRRFKQEVQLARQVSSPYVCRIHELFMLPADGQRRAGAFLTMELLAGVTLARRIEQGPLPWSEAEPIAIKLCQGLEALHALGLVHRDFKPANVMLTRRGDVTQGVVMDFGLALRPEESLHGRPKLTMTGGIVGTPGYMAPEQFEGGKVSPATDVYALGLVLYEMVTGKRPFEASTPLGAAVKRAKRPMAASSLQPGVPSRVDRVIEKCLEYEPSDRYQTAGEVAKALRGEGGRRAAMSSALLRRRTIAAYVILILVAVSGLFAWRIIYGSYKPTAKALDWYQQGLNPYRQGTYLTAKGMFDQSVKADPKFALAEARLADTLNELDYVGDAEEAMLRVTPEAEGRLSSLEGEYVEGVRATLGREYDNAVTHFRRVLDGLGAKEKAMGLVDLGRAYEKAGKIEAALSAYAEARKLPSDSPAPYLRSGILEARSARNDEAAKDFDKAEQLYHDLNNSEGMAEVFYQRSYWQTLLRNYVVARELAQKSKGAAQQMPQAAIQLEVRAWSRLSAIDHGDSRDLDAIKEATTAIELAEQNRLGYWQTDALCRLGSAHLGASYLSKISKKDAAAHSEDAKKYLEQALAIAEKNKWPRLVALAQVSLATVLEVRKEIDEKDISGLGSALQFYLQFGFPTESLNPLLLLARAHDSKSEYREGLKASMDLVNRADKYGAPVQRAQAWEEVGHAQFGLQNYSEASSAFEKAVEYSPQLARWEASYRANAFARLGQFDQASAALNQLSADEAEDLAEETEKIQIQSAMGRGLFPEAFRLVQAALANHEDLSGSDGADVRAQGAIALSKLGRKQEAARWISEAKTLAQGNRDEESRAVVAYDEAVISLNLGSPKQARQAAEEALKFFQRAGQQESEWLAMAVMAEADAAIGDKKRASSESMIALDMLGKFEHNCLGSASSTYRAQAEVAENCRRLDQLRHL
jgi:tetratricopeptide (TPR) repeat protein